MQHSRPALSALGSGIAAVALVCTGLVVALSAPSTAQSAAAHAGSTTTQTYHLGEKKDTGW